MNPVRLLSRLPTEDSSVVILPCSINRSLSVAVILSSSVSVVPVVAYCPLIVLTVPPRDVICDCSETRPPLSAVTCAVKVLSALEVALIALSAVDRSAVNWTTSSEITVRSLSVASTRDVSVARELAAAEICEKLESIPDRSSASTVAPILSTREDMADRPVELSLT